MNNDIIHEDSIVGLSQSLKHLAPRFSLELKSWIKENTWKLDGEIKIGATIGESYDQYLMYLEETCASPLASKERMRMRSGLDYL